MASDSVSVIASRIRWRVAPSGARSAADGWYVTCTGASSRRLVNTSPCTLPIDTGSLHALVEHPAGRSDERLARLVLLITWLLADQHQRRGQLAGTEHAVKRAPVERASTAALYCVPQCPDTGLLRYERGGVVFVLRVARPDHRASRTRRAAAPTTRRRTRHCRASRC